MASRGAVDLVDYFIRKSTRDMSSQMKQLDLESMKVTAKIRKACEIRLKMTQPFIRKWPEAVALLLLPQNLPTTLSNLHELVDEMWYLAGDRSVDVLRRQFFPDISLKPELYLDELL
ncbi:Ubiquinone biosynthesis protein coq9, mitochondrial [Nowakowskiella sp. JEL0407]|nr:Ubiquinone biosynthesis protein coq9, mitochondrial [Nowakowskiella sp. JEL0407]